MNQEIKEKWIKALESGEYKKGTHALKHGDKFCCLGVLTDIYIKETGNGVWKNHETKSISVFEGKDKNHQILPTDVIEWSGIESPNPTVKSPYNTCLAAVNDCTETFKEVIEIIKEQI